MLDIRQSLLARRDIRFEGTERKKQASSSAVLWYILFFL